MPVPRARRWHWDYARRVVDAGGVILYPTEGVYGLGCLFDHGPAVARILALKGRSVAKGLILLGNSLAQLTPLLNLSDVDTGRLEATWPGPVTWVVPASRRVPRWLTGGRSTLAVRVSAHPLATYLTAVSGPLVSTSANPTGRPPPRTLLRARGYFRTGVDLAVPGALGGARGPTEIRDALTGRVLRKGG
jgi:L-threonylcarbamoyladenylate synthase